MGLIQLANLEADEFERALEPHEVGPTPMASKRSATLVGRAEGSSGPLVYLGEIPITYIDAKRQIPYQEAILTKKEKKLVSGCTNWTRHEFKFDTTEENTAKFKGYIKAGYHLVQAKWPLESGLVELSPFKRRIKERPFLLFDPQHLLKPSDYYSEDNKKKKIKLFHELQSLEEYVKTLNNDFWEMQDCLTAGAFVPALTMAFPNEVRNDERTWLYGVCENAQEYFSELKQTPEVQELIRKTKDRTIQFTHRQAKITERIRLFDDDVKDIQSLCDIILDYSIYQALAGPEDDKEVARLFRKSVTEKVDSIYKEHLLNLNRRINTEIRNKKTGHQTLVVIHKSRRDSLRGAF